MKGENFNILFLLLKVQKRRHNEKVRLTEESSIIEL